MLRRKIEEKLQFWFENRKQALLVKGARQVGKSFSISSFIKDKFENVIEIDFSKRTDLIDTFALLNNSSETIPSCLPSKIRYSPSLALGRSFLIS